MLASSLLACLILISPAFSQQARYYFNENFGQIFYDYTLNLNHAVNGDSNLTISHDTIPLDRGAYFSDDNSSLSSYISFPKNEIVPNGFSTSSGLYVTMWVLFIESQSNQDQSIVNRFDKNSNTLLQLNKTKVTGQLIVHVRTGEFDIVKKSSEFYSVSNGNYYSDIWNYIILCVDGINIEVYLSNIPVISFQLPSPYTESVSPQFLLGHPSASFKGIVFESLIFTSQIVISDLFGGEYAPGYCLLYNCPKSCFPSYLSNNNNLYCLPTSNNTQIDSEGNQCEKMKSSGPKYGCYKNINLECNCSGKSCVIEKNVTRCWCSRKHGCECPVQMFFNGAQCATCNNDCASCDSSNSCSDCIAQNAEPSSDLGCQCREGFFNSTKLNHKSACSKCKDECRTCKDAETCEICQDLNAEFKGGSCRCKEGFFAGENGVCEACDGECEQCQKIGECLTCKDSNAVVKNGKCICNERYYNITTIYSEGTCLFCNLDCDSCDLQGECISCTSKNAVKSNKGCQCEEGYYNISSLFTISSCLKCLSNCKSCSQEISCDTCITLNASPHLSGCICDQGFYNTSQLTSQDSCRPCNNECQTCNSADQCITCKDKNASPDKLKGCICNTGYSNTTSLTYDGACKICDSTCKSCDSNFECLTCKSDNSEILPTKNGCKCQDRYYKDSELVTKNACKPCLGDCQSCENLNSCKTCRANFAIPTKYGCKCEDRYFNTTSLDTPSACLKCHSHCQTCESHNQCLTCISENAVLSPSGCICKPEYYNLTDLTSPSSCLKCHEDCLSCNSSSTCLTCIDKNSAPSSEGCACLPGFYLSQQENKKKCLPCNIDCSTCNSNTTCLTCKAENTSITKFGCNCLNGYYNSTLLHSIDSCKPCHSDCYNCTVADKCSRCKVPYAYSEEVGCKCMNGFFNTSSLNEGGKCERCNNDCLSCDNNLTCTMCKTEFAKPSHVGCECNDGFHNISSLVFEDSCIDIDLYSLSIQINETEPTVLFWFTVTVILENKDGLPMKSPINVTLFSLIDDLYPIENLTKLSTNGRVEFEVYCKTSNSNSLSVKIGPISNYINFIVYPQTLKIHSIEPLPKYESDNFQLEVGVYNNDKTQLGILSEDTWISLILNPDGDLKGEIEIKTHKGIGVFSGLRISPAGFYKLQVKGKEILPVTSHLIQINHDPKMGVRVLVEPEKPNVGFFFLLNVTLADQYGNLFGEDKIVTLGANKDIQGQTSKKTENSNALFELLCLEPGKMSIFIDAEIFNTTFVVEIKKNVVEARIVDGNNENFQPNTVNDEFSVILRVLNKVGGDIESYHGKYSINLAIEPFGIIKCDIQTIVTKSGSGEFSRCKILTSGSINLTVSSNLTDQINIGSFLIKNSKIQSISFSISEDPSAYIDFDIQFSVFSIDGQLFKESCILNLTGPTELKGQSLIYYQNGVVSSTYYSTLPGIKHLSVSLLEIQGANAIKILSNTLKFISLYPKPIHADQTFSAFIGIFSFDGSQAVNKTGQFHFTLDISPEQGVLNGKNESDSDLPTYNFTMLQIPTAGVFQLIAVYDNITFSKSGSVYIDTPVFEQIVTEVYPDKPSVHFEVEIKGSLFDQYDKPWNNKEAIEFEFEGFSENFYAENSKFAKKIVFQTTGIKKLIFRSGAVNKELEINVLSLRLLPVSLIPPTLKLGNSLDLIYGVFDNFGKNIQSKSYHYEVNLQFEPAGEVEGTKTSVTSNGYAIFKDIKIKNPGLYAVSASSQGILKCTSKIRTYLNSTVEVLITGLDSQFKAKIFYNFSVSAQNITSESKIQLDSTLIQVFLNQIQIESISSNSLESVYSIIFTNPGEYNIRAVFGEYFHTIDIIVMPSENTDKLCQVAYSAESCDKCLKRSENINGKCECVYGSAYSLDTLLCECVSPSETSADYCVPCRNYLSRLDIKAEFSSDYKSIFVYFSNQINTENLACNEIINPGYYSDLLKNCEWKSPLLLQLILSEYPILENSLLRLNNQKVLSSKGKCHYNLQELNINIEQTFSIPTPLAVIEAPKSFSTFCLSSGLKIKSKFISAQYTYKWVPQTDPENTELRLFVASQSTDHFLVPLKMLKTGKLMLELIVQNQNLKNIGKHRHTIEITSTRQHYTTISEHISEENVELFGEVFGSCQEVNKFVYEWSIMQGNVSEFLVENRPDVLLIPKAKLIEFNWDISLKVTDGNYQSYTDHKLSLIQKELVISLSRSSGSISDQIDLVVSFSVVDPNNLTPELNIRWTCTEPSGFCLDSYGKIIDLHIENSVLTIKKNDLRPLSELTLTIIVETLLKKAISSITLTVDPTIKGLSQLPIPLQRLNSDYTVNFISNNILSGQWKFKWDIEGEHTCGKVLLSTLPFLQLPEKCLSPGLSYKFQLEAIKKTEKILSFGEITINQGPICKGLTITEDVDKFLVSAIECLDAEDKDYPLMFQVGCKTEDSQIKWLKSALNDPHITVWIPQHATEIILRVIDSLGSFKLYSEKVQDTKRKLNDYSILLESGHRNFVNIPNLVIVYSRDNINLKSFNLLFEMFTEYFYNAIFDRFEMDLFIECLKSVLSVNLQDTQEIKAGSVDLIINVLGKYKFKLLNSQADGLLTVLDQNLALNSSINATHLINTICKALIIDTIPDFEYKFEGTFSLHCSLKLSDSYKSSLITGEYFSAYFPPTIDLPKESILRFTFIYFPFHLIPVFDFQCEKKGTFKSYNLIMTDATLIKLSLKVPIKISISNNKNYSFATCSNTESSCEVFAANSTIIEINIKESGTYIIQESNTCSNQRLPVYISAVIIAFTLIFSVIFYILDKKRRLMDSSNYNFSDLFNLLNLLKPRQSLLRVLSLFKLSASFFVIFSCVGLTYTSYIYPSPEISLSVTESLHINFGRCIIPLILSQVLFLINTFFFCCKRISQETRKFLILFNFSIICLSVIIIFLICNSVCFKNFNEWISASLISFGIEIFVLEPLNSLIICLCFRSSMNNFGNNNKNEEAKERENTEGEKLNKKKNELRSTRRIKDLENV